MADNILKGIIRIEAIGVEKTTADVNRQLSSLEKSVAAFGGGVKKFVPQSAEAFKNFGKSVEETTKVTERNFNALGSTASRLFKGLVGGAAIGLAISAMVNLGDAIKETIRNLDGLTLGQRQLNEVNKEAIVDSIKQRVQLDLLYRSASDVTKSTEERMRSVTELRKLLPGYFDEIKTEGDLNNKLAGAYGNATAGILSKARATAAFNKIVENENKLLELRTKLESLAKKGGFSLGDIFKPLAPLGGDALTVLNNQIKELEAANGKLGNLADFISPKAIPEIKVKDIKVKPDKLVIKPPREIVFQDLERTKIPDLSFITLEQFLPKDRKIDLSKTVQINYDTEGLNKIKEGLEEIGRVGLAVGNIFADSFGQLFTALVQGGNAIQAFGQAFVQALTQVIAKLIQTVILSLILSAVGGGIGIGASSNKLGDIFKFLGGGFGGFRAGGGPVSSNKGYIVGENGPEFFQPGVSGNIVPNNRLGSFGSMGIGGSGGEQLFRLRGSDLILATRAAGRSQIRLT